MEKLRREIRSCTLCSEYWPLGPNPVFQFGKGARIMIVGQAPGRKVHDSGIPWRDASGNRLREWLGIDETVFYDESKIGLVPMGFCYPGKGSNGDLPPREECAPMWHSRIFKAVGKVELTLLIGQYAQAYYLSHKCKDNLTATVRAFEEFGPGTIPLPHPSPRNNIWLKKNPWFTKELLPKLREQVKGLI